MANRSYLYAVDELPGEKKKGKQTHPRGLSEFNWNVPVSHLVLASHSPRRCRSAIWEEHEIGVIADDDGTVDLLLRLLDTIGAGKVKDAEEYAAAVAATRKFLGAKKNRKRYFLLEAGEIFDMEGGDLVKRAARLVEKEIPAAAARATGAIAGKEKVWLATLRKEWREQLGIEWWSDVLYFSF